MFRQYSHPRMACRDLAKCMHRAAFLILVRLFLQQSTFRNDEKWLSVFHSLKKETEFWSLFGLLCVYVFFMLMPLLKEKGFF